MGETENIDLIEQTYQFAYGNDELVQLLTARKHTVEVIEFTPKQFLAFGGTVLATGIERVRVQRTGRALEWNWAHLWTIKDGQIVEIKEFYSAGAGAAAF